MKYQNNKDLAEAQYYLKMLDDFCKSGQVKIPDPTGIAMPWNLKEDPLKDYLIHLFTLKVTIEETGEEVQKFVRQVVNSKIKSKVFYDSVGNSSWNASITCGSSASVPGPRVIGLMMCSIGLPSSGWMNRCGSPCSTSWNRNMLKMGSINLSSSS